MTEWFRYTWILGQDKSTRNLIVWSRLNSKLNVKLANCTMMKLATRKS